MSENKNNKNNNYNNSFPAMEEEVLAFWDKAEIFAKSVNRQASPGLFNAAGKNYVFYDGPPFGTGEPHYGHILSSIAKDVVPRYFTMKGYRVERRWGWDCHGLPIENIIEADLKMSGKKEIAKMGIAKFNEACRSRVLEYADIWDKMIHRIGRWVDFKNSYKTMDLSYMESVWWAFKQLWQKDLIYQGRKVLLYCPRCETPISNFEVAMDNSYQEITEPSVYAKFKIAKPTNLQISYKFTNIDKAYILAWTTTPWTLPGNVALAVGENIAYAMIQMAANNKTNGREYYILAKDRLGVIDEKYELVAEFKGKELIGLDYEPLFDVPALRESGKRVHYVAEADFVTTEDGTGVVHTAVVYGEDDYNLGLRLDLPVVPALDEKGYFNETVPQFKGVYFKAADKKVIADLEKRGLLYKQEDYKHPYPFCHRCATQLFYNAIPAWFLNISKIRKTLLKTNEKINWFPEHLKHGRFAQGIEQAPDWNISRNRYFATPMPIWQCDKCGEREIIGSVAELEKKSGRQNIKDIHSHFIDGLTWSCSKCKGAMQRISEVFDCWVESGSMSFAQHHYPFENKEKFESTFPAQYITEYISQTRAWFYVMHVMSTALFSSNSFENVVTTGVILNEKGDKMSKSKRNFPDPWKVINEFGVDALRFYLMSSSLMHAENLFFNERELRDVFRKNMMLLWNVYKFYKIYANERQGTLTNANIDAGVSSENILDKWILARLEELIKNVTAYMDGYDLPRAARQMTEFIDDLSTWYIRRSRDRFKSEDLKAKEDALKTTGFVLAQLAKVIAPFMPFIAEQIWQGVTGHEFKNENKSVHLEVWPKAGEINEELIRENKEYRKIIEDGLAQRNEEKIKIRQPLQAYASSKSQPLPSSSSKSKISTSSSSVAYTKITKEELNVKELNFNAKEDKLDINLTPELMQEGAKREIVRFINNMRKQAGFTIADRVDIYWQTDDQEIRQAIEKYKNDIIKDTLAGEMNEDKNDQADLSKEIKINGAAAWLGIKKI